VEGDSLLYVDVCINSFARQVLLRGFRDIEVTWRDIGTVRRDVHNLRYLAT